VEADNLDAMKWMAAEGAGSLRGLVDVLYLDPPYNTNHAFVYEDRRGRGPEARRRWVEFLLPRLLAARPLLAPDGVVLASIDDREMPTLRFLLDEVFGAESFRGTLVWRSRRVVDSRNRSGISGDHEYVLVYGGALLGVPVEGGKYANADDDPRGPWMSDNLLGLATKRQRPRLHYDLLDPATGRVYPCPPSGWRYAPETMARKIAEGRILWPRAPEGRPRHKRFLSELRRARTGLSSWLDLGSVQGGAAELRALLGRRVFDFPKPVALMRLLMAQAARPRALVLDPFAGSGTTGQALLELNAEDGGDRRFVLVELDAATGDPLWPTLSSLCEARLRVVMEGLGEGMKPLRVVRPPAVRGDDPR
jgi:adenine-specific DNA-methyltransferase